MDLVKTELLERKEIDRALELATLTGEHLLLTGSPGTAKSLQAERYFKHFPSGKTFSAQLSKFSTEEVLFGALNIQKLRQGEYEYLYKGTILDAHFAYIDEVFDASDVLLRSLLSVLNERQFQRGNFKVKCPLLTAVATANYTRVNEVTEAVVDRFLFQLEVKPLSDKNALLSFNADKFTPHATTSLNELRTLRNTVADIKIPRNVQEVYIGLAKEYNFTDRRIVKGAKVLKASAMLNMRPNVSMDDLMSVQFFSGLNSKVSVAEIRDLIYERGQIAEQMEFVKKIWGRFDRYCEKSQTDPTILREINRDISNLINLNPINDEVADRRDNLQNTMEEYYAKGKELFLRSQGL